MASMSPSTSVSFVLSPLFLVLALLAAASLFLYRRLASLSQPALSNPTCTSKHMTISEIYVYPIKSLRPTQVSTAVATRKGFQYDRSFMILEVIDGGASYKNMAVSNYPKMTQFLTHIILPEDHSNAKGSIMVEFIASKQGQSTTLEVPLQPETHNLETFEITMHRSSTKAYKMPAEYNSWFSSCFGYDVVLAYLGDNHRDCLFDEMLPTKNSSWISKISRTASLLGPSSPGEKITFADCAPYLVVTQTSLAAVSSILPENEVMDVTKFRPNIVIKGAETAWEEDFWGKIKINDAEIIMKHNCARCKSINIDYSTGSPGTGPGGEVLKKMQKDRRVDPGSKYSPIFGRYSFWNPKIEPKVLSVGDKVSVVQVGNSDNRNF
ncbi:hypothetical protein K504DRAFT_500000 [Pleomassaria siparia CBS 279.74]|uniref:MOSC domain-containing protein n=1 Tax=Pleomassaria siparia CBS 279.74 TaxID=1314801 RepID=A0A6G1KFT1_9PLEO|nr:hypothetical protein K504DRAFT_500000 [Pleomassaria siparia CBS 279.74]